MNRNALTQQDIRYIKTLVVPAMGFECYSTKVTWGFLRMLGDDFAMAVLRLYPLESITNEMAIRIIRCMNWAIGKDTVWVGRLNSVPAASILLLEQLVVQHPGAGGETLLRDLREVIEARRRALEDCEVDPMR